jgi:hypothetical protein
MPAYSIMNSYYMRIIRLCAYLQEWIFEASYSDSYVPSKVHLQRYRAWHGTAPKPELPTPRATSSLRRVDRRLVAASL